MIRLRNPEIQGRISKKPQYPCNEFYQCVCMAFVIEHRVMRVHIFWCMGVAPEVESSGLVMV